MQYLILEKGNGHGCDYTIGCNQRWKVVESDLPYEQFKYRCIKYALFGGDADANWEDYCGLCDENQVAELHIIELPTLLTVDLEAAREYFNNIYSEETKQALKEDKLKQFYKLKEELGM